MKEIRYEMQHYTRVDPKLSFVKICEKNSDNFHRFHLVSSLTNHPPTLPANEFEVLTHIMLQNHTYQNYPSKSNLQNHPSKQKDGAHRHIWPL